MKCNQIINSLLETDLYKFSMGQVIYHRFPGYTTTWTFKCRNKDVKFTLEMYYEIVEQIKAFCNLRFTEEELDYLRTITWLHTPYIDYLRNFAPNFNHIHVSKDAECGLAIEAEGSWLETSMYEIPILAIVNEVYFRMGFDYDELFESFKEHLADKCERIKSQSLYLGTFSEFGLRRRLSAEAQELAIKELIDATKNVSSNFIGTSNVYLAKKLGIKPVGTMAHEYIMCVGQGNNKHNAAYSNWYAMDAWIKEYGVMNGIALTDTVTTDVFLKDFQLTFATLFSGVRHDSGDPYEWGEKMIKHYESLGIDPKTKTLLFSDSLDFDRASALFYHFNSRINVAFGIGTYISNDTKEPALNIVMKTTECNGHPVAKISDTPGKCMCKDAEYVDYLQRTLKWRLDHE